jgi:hypothetical protein
VRATVRVAITTAPRDARLTLDGAAVTGPDVDIPDDGAPHTLRASAPGWRDAIRTVSGDGPRALVIRLGHKSIEHKQAIRPSLPRPLDP